MGVDNKGFDYTIVAGADLSTSQYCGVTLAGAISAIGLTFGGVLYNKPQIGEHGQVRALGMSKFRAGAAVAAGVPITVTTSGYFITATSGQNAIGDAVFAAASGYLGTALLRGRAYVNSY